MTQPVARRARATAAAVAPAQPVAAAAAPAPATGYLRRGANAVFATAEVEAQKAAERAERRKSGIDNVFRFRLQPGEKAEFIILDESLETLVALYEHNLPGPKNNWQTHEVCVKEFANCVLCDRYEESYYAMFLSGIDTRGYDRNIPGGTGKEHIPYSRKLLPIKAGSIPKWRNVLTAAMEEFGTIRGLCLMLERPKTGQSTNIGEPAVLPNGKVYDWIDEEQLDEEFGHDAILGRDGRTVIKEANVEITAFDYDALFTDPDPDDLNQRYGATAGAGSARQVVEEFGATEAANTQPARTRTRATAAAAAAPAPAPVAGTRTRATAVAAAPVGRTRPLVRTAAPATAAPVAAIPTRTRASAVQAAAPAPAPAGAPLRRARATANLAAPVEQEPEEPASDEEPFEQ